MERKLTLKENKDILENTIKSLNSNKSNCSKLKKQEQGITLIALVVTIIVLLILARNNNKFSIWKWRHYRQCK